MNPSAPDLVTTTSYLADETTVTQANVTRKTRVDGFRRVVEVVEDPDGKHYLTSYRFDALLVTVRGLPKPAAR